MTTITTRTLTNIGNAFVHPDGSPVISAHVNFFLVGSTSSTPIDAWTATGHKVASISIAQTSALGEFSIALVPNDILSPATRYLCSIPEIGALFYGIVLSGAGDITWLEFYENAAPLAPFENTLLQSHIANTIVHVTQAEHTFLTNAYQTGAIGPTGPTGPQGPAYVPNKAECHYFNLTGTNIAISAQSDGTTNLVKVSIPTSLDLGVGFDNGGVDDGRIRKTSAGTENVMISCSLSVSPQINNDSFVFAITKNDSTQVGKALQKLGNSSDVQTVTFGIYIISMATNDHIDVYVGNTAGTGDILIKAFNVMALGCG